MASSDTSDEKKGSGGIAGIILVTLIALGAGGGFGLYLSGDMKTPEEPIPEAAQKAKAEAKPADPIKLVGLDPIIANLSEPKTAWMRVEASLVVEGEIENVAALGAKIGEDVVAYLKTVTLAQFEGASGFQNLREDLNDRARIRGGPQVRELVIHGLVVE